MMYLDRTCVDCMTREGIKDERGCVYVKTKQTGDLSWDPRMNPRAT